MHQCALPKPMLEKQEGMCCHRKPDDGTLWSMWHCSLRHTKSVTYQSLSTGSNKVYHSIKRKCCGKRNWLIHCLSHCSLYPFLDNGILNWMVGLICLYLWIYVCLIVYIKAPFFDFLFSSTICIHNLLQSLLVCSPSAPMFDFMC